MRVCTVVVPSPSFSSRHSFLFLSHHTHQLEVLPALLHLGTLLAPLPASLTVVAEASGETPHFVRSRRRGLALSFRPGGLDDWKLLLRSVPAFTVFYFFPPPRAYYDELSLTRVRSNTPFRVTRRRRSWGYTTQPWTSTGGVGSIT